MYPSHCRFSRSHYWWLITWTWWVRQPPALCHQLRPRWQPRKTAWTPLGVWPPEVRPPSGVPETDPAQVPGPEVNSWQHPIPRDLITKNWPQDFRGSFLVRVRGLVDPNGNGLIWTNQVSSCLNKKCKWLAIFSLSFCQLLFQMEYKPLIHLLLIFEESRLKNQVRQTGFLTCKNQFRNWFLQATQTVKIQFVIN